MELEAEPFAEPATKRILIVDDDEGQVDLLRLLVGAEGFRADAADNGMTALERIQAGSPDLVLLDLMMPGLGGFELVRELQAHGLGDVPVVLITGCQVDPKTIDMMKREHNVKEVVRKPPRPAAFVTMLHQLLHTRPPLKPATGA